MWGPKILVLDVWCQNVNILASTPPKYDGFKRKISTHPPVNLLSIHPTNQCGQSFISFCYYKMTVLRLSVSKKSSRYRKQANFMNTEREWKTKMNTFELHHYGEEDIFWIMLKISAAWLPSSVLLKPYLTLPLTQTLCRYFTLYALFLPLSQYYTSYIIVYIIYINATYTSRLLS